MRDLRHIEDVLLTFEKFIDSESALIRFYTAICEINRACRSFHNYESKYGPKDYSVFGMIGQLPKDKQKYRNLEQYIEANNLLKKDLTKIPYLSYFNYDEKNFFVYHKNAISKKYCEFIDAFRTNQLDSGSLNYKAIDIYKHFGSSVLDKQMPNEDIQLEKVPLFSKRLMRAFFNEYRDDIKNYLIFTFLAIIALIIILKCDNPMIKLIPAGFLAFAYFATTFVAFNSFFDRIMKDEDKAFRFGCTSQILFSLIPAILIFFGGVYYNFKTNEFYHNTESSSEINGFYGGYNTSLSDDNLNDNVEVYITASGNGSCYHINPDCISLARSKSLIKMTKKEARKKDLKPCHNCTAN